MIGVRGRGDSCGRRCLRRKASELIRRGRELKRKQCRYEDEAQGKPSSSFVRPPKPSAAQRARDAAAATADYKAEQLATLAKTARLKKLRLEKQAADDDKASASGRGK